MNMTAREQLFDWKRLVLAARGATKATGTRLSNERMQQSSSQLPPKDGTARKLDSFSRMTEAADVRNIEKGQSGSRMVTIISLPCGNERQSGDRIGQDGLRLSAFGRIGSQLRPAAPGRLPSVIGESPNLTRSGYSRNALLSPALALFHP